MIYFTNPSQQTFTLLPAIFTYFLKIVFRVNNVYIHSYLHVLY